MPTTRVITPSILDFGTPVVLLTTTNADGLANISPMSSRGRPSCWSSATTARLSTNLQRLGECVINLPAAEFWDRAERIAPLTGRSPAPEDKREKYQYEPDKFGVAGLTPVPSDLIRPPRIDECGLRLEAEVASMTPAGEGGFVMVDRRPPGP